MTEAHPPLAIGAVAGGPGTDRAWSDAVKDLGRVVMAARAGVESPLAVNVVFQIPGAFLQPELEGIRTGRFSRKDARLLVQVGLPRIAPLDPAVEVRRLLAAAVVVAEDFARQEGMVDGGLTELRGLVARL